MKILFVHQALQSFVQKDLDMLRSAHEVRPICFTGRRGLAKHLIRDLWHLWKGILWCDLTFSWFGKLHAFFAVLFSKMLGKKAVVVAGNDDVFKFTYKGQPYGILAHPVKKWIAYFTFRYANRILAVSKTSLEEAIYNAKADSRKTEIIYHGFNCGVFKKRPDVEKEKMVVTVGRVTDETYIQKGLKLFVDSARLLPNIPFVLVGPFLDGSIRRLKNIAPQNVTFTGWVEERRLIHILSKATVYVQASIHEAFGCSIAEAMLCECVPVVAKRTAMPEVVGNAGYYIENLTAKELSEAIYKALADEEMGVKARERIVYNFPLEERYRKILAALEELTSPTLPSPDRQVTTSDR